MASRTQRCRRTETITAMERRLLTAAHRQAKYGAAR